MTKKYGPANPRMSPAPSSIEDLSQYSPACSGVVGFLPPPSPCTPSGPNGAFGFTFADSVVRQPLQKAAPLREKYGPVSLPKVTPVLRDKYGPVSIQKPYLPKQLAPSIPLPSVAAMFGPHQPYVAALVVTYRSARQHASLSARSNSGDMSPTTPAPYMANIQAMSKAPQARQVKAGPSPLMK